MTRPPEAPDVDKAEGEEEKYWAWREYEERLREWARRVVRQNPRLGAAAYVMRRAEDEVRRTPERYYVCPRCGAELQYKCDVTESILEAEKWPWYDVVYIGRTGRDVEGPSWSWRGGDHHGRAVYFFRRYECPRCGLILRPSEARKYLRTRPEEIPRIRKWAKRYAEARRVLQQYNLPSIAISALASAYAEMKQGEAKELNDEWARCAFEVARRAGFRPGLIEDWVIAVNVWSGEITGVKRPSELTDDEVGFRVEVVPSGDKIIVKVYNNYGEYCGWAMFTREGRRIQMPRVNVLAEAMRELGIR